MKTVQEKRRATMSRLTATPTKRYDTRQHRRGVYVAAKWLREHLAGHDVSGLCRRMIGDAHHFTHRRFKGARAAV